MGEYLLNAAQRQKVQSSISEKKVCVILGTLTHS